MPSNSFRTGLDSWPWSLFIAVGFGLWGVSKLTRGSGGADTFFGAVFLLVAVGHGARAVLAFRNRPPD